MPGIRPCQIADLTRDPDGGKAVLQRSFDVTREVRYGQNVVVACRLVSVAIQRAMFERVVGKCNRDTGLIRVALVMRTLSARLA